MTNNGQSVDFDISEDEAALYDRQIRLWGLDSQKRLRNSKVLMIGMDGLGAEICKNLVLAGMKSLTIVDSAKVTEKDLSTQFLIPRNCLGKNRAESSVDALRQLNPQVELQTATEMPSDGDIGGHYDVVCVSSGDPTLLIRLDNLCHQLGAKFYCGCTWGLFAFAFLDLQHHSYVQEIPEFQRRRPTQQQLQRQAKDVIVVEDELPKDGALQNLQTIEYVTLEKALEVRMGGKLGSGLKPRTSPTFFLLHVVLKFWEQEGRAPQEETREKDLATLISLRESVMASLGADSSRLSDTLLESVFYGNLSPVCAIAGGIIAQEIIKGVSGKDTPLTNFFLLNGLEGCGLVEAIGTK